MKTNQRFYLSRFLLCACLSLLAAKTAMASNYSFEGVGNWTDAALWSPSYPGTTISAGDSVDIHAGSICTIAVATAVSINFGGSLSISRSSRLNNAGSLFIAGNLIKEGSLYNTGGLLTLPGISSYHSLTSTG